MESNGDWQGELDHSFNHAMVWKTPGFCVSMAAEVRDWPVSRDPANTTDSGKIFLAFADMIRQAGCK